MDNRDIVHHVGDSLADLSGGRFTFIGALLMMKLSRILMDSE